MSAGGSGSGPGGGPAGSAGGIIEQPRLATEMVYQGMTIAVMLLLLGSLWVF